MSAGMQADLAAIAYLVSGVLFILALRGLSSPESSRTGNIRGMLGMAIAVATTLWVTGVRDPVTWGMIAGGIAVGGVIGAVVARRISMTAMPQLVAAFHSLVVLPRFSWPPPSCIARPHTTSAQKERSARKASSK
jgi:NAD(P) transhydrogenase subunit beta